MKRALIILVVGIASVSVAPLWGAANKPVVPPPSAPEEKHPEIDAYNAGCSLLKKQKWAEAQAKFETALKMKEAFAEAHNNLGYVLRKQSAQNYPASLVYYNRAIELAPRMAEPYMYRGALFVFMGRMDLAEADYVTLQKLRSSLAGRLKKVIDSGKEDGSDYPGVSRSK